MAITANGIITISGPESVPACQARAASHSAESQPIPTASPAIADPMAVIRPSRR